MSRVCQLGLKRFGSMVWKLLIIEPFSQWNLGAFLVLLESLRQVNLIEFISQFQSQGVEDISFLSGFWCWKFKQIVKIGFGRKI